MKAPSRIVLMVAIVFMLKSFSFATAQQGAAPLVEVELSETETIPGQPVVLRVTVLVPTWLPRPVTFPTFEVPDLMVKLPERATSPVSRTIEGETWSGVSRAYRISPMVPGIITTPDQALTIYWADPGKTEPRVTQMAIASFSITGVVPAGAEDLDPFIAATALTLTEKLSSENRILKPGDSLTREVTLSIEGASPLSVPTLLVPHEITGTASYPAEPEVTETTHRNWVSGARVESTTLVAESGGTGSVPAVEVNWYNLETKRVETARVEGFDLVVDGPPARNRPDGTLRVLIAAVAVGILLFYALIRVSRWALPRFAAWRHQRAEIREASESWAYALVQRAVQQRDYGAFMAAFRIWKKRMPNAQGVENATFQTALFKVGRGMFGPTETEPQGAWNELARALEAYRKQCFATSKHSNKTFTIAPINPR